MVVIGLIPPIKSLGPVRLGQGLTVLRRILRNPRSWGVHSSGRVSRKKLTRHLLPDSHLSFFRVPICILNQFGFAHFYARPQN